MWHWTCTQLPLPDSVPKIMADDVSYVFSNVKVLTDKWGFFIKVHPWYVWCESWDSAFPISP